MICWFLFCPFFILPITFKKKEIRIEVCLVLKTKSIYNETLQNLYSVYKIRSIVHNIYYEFTAFEHHPAFPNLRAKGYITF